MPQQASFLGLPYIMLSFWGEKKKKRIAKIIIASMI
jgi:hypothetical protein